MREKYEQQRKRGIEFFRYLSLEGTKQADVVIKESLKSEDMGDEDKYDKEEILKWAQENKDSEDKRDQELANTILEILERKEKNGSDEV